MFFVFSDMLVHYRHLNRVSRQMLSLPPLPILYIVKPASLKSRFLLRMVLQSLGVMGILTMSSSFGE